MPTSEFTKTAAALTSHAADSYRKVLETLDAPPSPELIVELRRLSASLGARLAAVLRADSEFRQAGFEQLPDDVRALVCEIACSFQMIAGATMVEHFVEMPLVSAELLERLETPGVYSWLARNQA